MKSKIKLLTFVVMAGLLAFTFIWKASSVKGQQDETREKIGSDKASPRTSKRVGFQVKSPSSNQTLVGVLSKKSEDTHSFPTFKVHLEDRDGVHGGWELDGVIYAMWNDTGSALTLEDEQHHLFVVKNNEAPVFVGVGFTTPSLSPSGKFLSAQKLGEGEHILTKLQNSQGLAIIDLETGAERIVVKGDAFMPFFIGENRLGYGSTSDGIASLYMRDLRFHRTTRLTNTRGQSENFDPFPESLPRFNTLSGKLSFAASQEESQARFELSLTRKETTMLEGYQAFEKSDFFVENTEQTQELNEVVKPVQITSQASRPVAEATGKTLFRMPLDNYQGVYKFADHGGKDWNCGTRLYKGHNGTDFKAARDSKVLAAASGKVIRSVAGCSNTGYIGSTCGGGFGNHVKLEHSDKRVTVYGHMKSGTAIPEKKLVSCGDTVGLSASSGSSDAPHLHFEIWENSSIGKRMDPYKGSCNAIDSTDWVSQSNVYPSAEVSKSCQK